MLRRSASIYGAGFLFGIISSAIIILVYPALYQAFLDFLRRKVEVQGALIQNFTLMLIANNLLAAGMASFGGTAVSKVVNFFDPETARNKAILYALPVGILFVNGEVLGLLAVLFIENISRFLSGIFPHGFFEIPAIILSGSIGLELSEESQGYTNDFQSNLNRLVRGRLKKFGIVVLLIIIGGALEGGAL
jgi:uncharacterized membrane protein SpoIIM required for sporulation